VKKRKKNKEKKNKNSPRKKENKKNSNTTKLQKLPHTTQLYSKHLLPCSHKLIFAFPDIIAAILHDSLLPLICKSTNHKHENAIFMGFLGSL